MAKYQVPSDNCVIIDPIEQWMFFSRRASELTAEELIPRLPDPAFAEATGVFEMIAKTPADRQFYEARLKMQRDEQARLEFAGARGANWTGQVAKATFEITRVRTGRFAWLLARGTSGGERQPSPQLTKARDFIQLAIPSWLADDGLRSV